MPCYDERNTYSYGRQEAQKDIDKLTQLLCEACNLLEHELGDLADVDGASLSLRKWWQKHKEFDRRRGARK